MSVELRHLRAFVAVADLRSFSGAADELGTSQPVVTRRLQQLEALVGRSLITRTTRQVELTATGRAFLEDARSIVAMTDASLAKLTGVRRLRLGFPWAPPSPWITEVIDAFEHRYGYRIELIRCDEVDAELLAGHIEVALTRTHSPHAEIRELPLATEPRVAVVSSTGPLANRRSLTWAELGNNTLVVNTVNGTTTPDLWPSEHRPTDIVTCHNFDEWAELVAAGRGVGALPESAVTFRLAGGLRTITLTDAPPAELLLAYARWNREPAERVGAVAKTVPLQDGSPARTAPTASDRPAIRKRTGRE